MLPNRDATAGTICGMSVKTTVYLPDDLKAAVERDAAQRAISEAEVIRQAIAAWVTRPAPHFGVIDGEPFAERVDELMGGFGER
jgi:predicted transcriptional regulator